jgi:hypothetical protein
MRISFITLIKPLLTLSLSPSSLSYLSSSFLTFSPSVLFFSLHFFPSLLFFSLLFLLFPLTANGERLGSLQQDPSSPYYGMIVGAITFFVLLAMYTFFS